VTLKLGSLEATSAAYASFHSTGSFSESRNSGAPKKVATNSAAPAPSVA
jgi:hypothetical protein